MAHVALDGKTWACACMSLASTHMMWLTYGSHLVDGKAIGNVWLNDLGILPWFHVAERECSTLCWRGPVRHKTT